MTLNVGSITATLDLDRRPFERNLSAWRTRTRAETRAATNELTSESYRQSQALARPFSQAEGRRSGQGFGSGVVGGLQAQAPAADRAGAAYGENFAAGFKRDVNGRLRDARGKFVPEGRAAGQGFGGGFRDGLRLSLGDGDGSFVRRVLESYKGAFEISAKSAATAFSAQFTGSVVAGLASGALKVAHGVGSIAALIPAAVLTAVTALGTMKLALSGVGDALDAAVTGDSEEFKEAIKNLSPAARGFAREVRGMRGELTGLRQSVQEGFFSRFEGQASKLGKTWLPILRRELTGVSSVFGSAADRFATWARQPAVVLTLTAALRNARGALGNLLGGASNLAQAFLPLVAVGSTFLPRLTRGFGDATARFALFMQHAADSGKLARFIQGGIDKLKSLWETAKQVGRIIGNVIDIFQEFRGSGGIFEALGIQTGGLLDQIEQLSEKAKAFFQSDAGGTAITGIFEILRSTMSATMGTLAHLATIVGRVFAPLLPQMSKFSEAAATFQLALADGLEPALQAVADALEVILPPATDLLGLMSDNAVVMGGLAGVIAGLYAAWKLGAIAAKIAQSGLNITMAGAAAAAGGLAMAILAIDAENKRKEIDRMVEGFIAMDGAITPATRGMVYINQLMGEMDSVMRTLIDTNPRVAQSIIDQAVALGISTDDAAEYQRQLDLTTAAADNATDAFTRQKDTLRAMSDPVFAAIDAQRRLREAQEKVVELEKSGTATAEEMAAVHQAVTEAAFDQDAAMFDLAAAMQNGETSMEAVLGAMKRQVKQGSATRADYNATAFMAAAAFGGIKKSVESVPRQRSTTVIARDHATAVIAKIAAKMERLNGTHAQVSIGASVAGAIGGAFATLAPKRKHHTGRVGGDEYVALLQRGESVLARNDPLNKAYVAAGGDSSKMVAGGGVSTVDITIHGTGLLEGLREQIQVRGGGNVQRALGQN